MSFYTTAEINDILTRLSEEPVVEKFITFERLGVFVELKEELMKLDSPHDGQLYTCSVCTKKLISAHLLDLHVAENHDSYFQLQKDKKPVVSKLKFSIPKLFQCLWFQFACFLEECKHMSSSPEDRKDHCIKSHKFPHDFRFDKVGRRVSKSDMDTTETAAAPSKPKVKSFHFGHRTLKTFESRSKRADAIETMAVDLTASLPDV